MLLKTALGRVLRDLRLEANLTLRQVCAKAFVSLGYLSEVERGQKEVSSELLRDVAGALGVSVSFVLTVVAERMADIEFDTALEELTSASALL